MTGAVIPGNEFPSAAVSIVIFAGMPKGIMEILRLEKQVIKIGGVLHAHLLFFCSHPKSYWISELLGIIGN
jgi:hypothetical protein